MSRSSENAGILGSFGMGNAGNGRRSAGIRMLRLGRSRSIENDGIFGSLGIGSAGIGNAIRGSLKLHTSLADAEHGEEWRYPRRVTRWRTSHENHAGRYAVQVHVAVDVDVATL